GNAQPLETRELAWNVRLSWHRKDGLAPSLALAVAGQPLENFRGTPNVELGEGIVEQKNRRACRALGKGGRLQHPQNYRRSALLARRTEYSDVASVERHDQVIAVRADLRDATPH